MLMLSLAASEDATQKFKTSTNLCVYMQGARRVEGVAVWLGVLYQHSFQHSVFPHLPVNGAVHSILSSPFCLQSTVVVEKSIQDLMNLMQDLSTYSNQFLEMVCDKLKEYKDICNTAYR